jgi:hypothetical protein
MNFIFAVALESDVLRQIEVEIKSLVLMALRRKSGQSQILKIFVRVFWILFISAFVFDRKWQIWFASLLPSIFGETYIAQMEHWIFTILEDMLDLVRLTLL